MKKQTNEPFGTPDADGWYEWKGNDMIRPAGLVDVVFRDRAQSNNCSADTWEWNHESNVGDIVKWRPAK